MNKISYWLKLSFVSLIVFTIIYLLYIFKCDKCRFTSTLDLIRNCILISITIIFIPGYLVKIKGGCIKHYISIFILSFLFTLGMYGVFNSFDKIFLLQTHLPLLIPKFIIAFIFSVVYYLLFLLSISMGSLMLVFVIIGYPLSLIVGEILAVISNNFLDTMACRGPGCVSLLMTIYGSQFFFFIPIFLVAMYILFRFLIKKRSLLPNTIKVGDTFLVSENAEIKVGNRLPLKKIIGSLLVLITVVWSWYLLWSGFYQSVAFPRAGFPVLSVFLAVLLLILVLPVGVSYIFSKNELLKAGRVAVWLHLSSIIILVLGFLPYLPCILNRGNCDKGGVGEMILFVISALVAGALYVAGLVALSINKSSRISSSSPTGSLSQENS